MCRSTQGAAHAVSAGRPILIHSEKLQRAHQVPAVYGEGDTVDEAPGVAGQHEKRYIEFIQLTQALGGSFLDIRSPASVNNALDEIESSPGATTVLINNAGVADSRHFMDVDEASWDFVMETNLKGAWRIARSVAQRLLEREIAGSIVNVASILGLRVGFGESTYASRARVVLVETELGQLSAHHVKRLAGAWRIVNLHRVSASHGKSAEVESTEENVAIGPDCSMQIVGRAPHRKPSAISTRNHQRT